MQLKTMRLNTLSTFVLLTFGLFLLGCDGAGLTGSGESGASSASAERGGPSDPGGGQGSGKAAEVRVAHLSPDAPGVDIYVGKEPDEGSPTIGGLTYPNFAPNSSGEYEQFEPGTVGIAVTPAGNTSDQVIDVDGLELKANKDYTILAVGELAPEELSPEGDEPGIQALPLVDNADEETALPPRDRTLVRFVHASPDAGTVDIAVDGGPTLVSDAEFGDASGYIEVAPGDYTITVGPGALEEPFEVPFTAKAGTKVTAYVIGNATPEDTPEDGDGLDEDDEALSAVTSLEAKNPAGTGPVGSDPGNSGASVFRASLTPVNGSGVEGEAEVKVNGDRLSVTANSRGLEPGVEHAQHFHEDATCSPPGSPIVSLDDDIANEPGDAINADEGDDSFPTATPGGTVNYQEKASKSATEEAGSLSLDLANRTVVVHAAGDEDPIGPPVACGELSRVGN